jgi:hypothetical protein
MTQKYEFSTPGGSTIKNLQLQTWDVRRRSTSLSLLSERVPLVAENWWCLDVTGDGNWIHDSRFDHDRDMAVFGIDGSGL